MIKQPKGIVVGPGQVMTPYKVENLARLAEAGEKGAGSAVGYLDGAMLAAFVQFGFAERIGIDRLGSTIYRVNAAGHAFLAGIGR